MGDFFMSSFEFMNCYDAPILSSSCTTNSLENQPKPPTKDSTSKECVICFDNVADTALLECGHLSCCNTCAKPLKICPICRGHVSKVVKIYQS